MAGFDAGNTFLLRAPNQTKWHLNVVVCGPDGNPPKILTVQFNSWTPYGDQTLVLHIGDHPFIKHDTCVSYDLSYLLDVSNLDKLEKINQIRNEADRDFRRCENVSDDLLQILREGMSQSDLIPNEILQEFKIRTGISRR